MRGGGENGEEGRGGKGGKRNFASLENGRKILFLSFHSEFFFYENQSGEEKKTKKK